MQGAVPPAPSQFRQPQTRPSSHPTMKMIRLMDWEIAGRIGKCLEKDMHITKSQVATVCNLNHGRCVRYLLRMERIRLIKMGKVISFFLMNKRVKKSGIFTIRSYFIFVSILLFCGFGFHVVGATELPLYKQIQSGVENRHLECGKPDHLLVIRQSLQFACVTEESASRTGWKKVSFSEDNDMVINYMPLEIKVDGKEFYINATLKNGLIQKVWKEYGELFLKINSSDDGEAKLSIPKLFFSLPENSFSPKIYVIENLKKSIIPGVKFEQDKYVVEFSFLDNDPKIGISLGYVLN